MKINANFRQIIISLSMACVVAFSSVSAMAEENVKVYVNGEQLIFDVNPIIENGRTLVPVRAIFEALGATVDWDEETQTVSAIKENGNLYKTITMRIGDNQMFTYSGDSTAEIPPPGMARIELDVPPTIIDGRTLVPVRAISESFGATVEWDEQTQSVFITYAEPVQTPAPSVSENTENTDEFKLSDADMELLKAQKELVRYQYEQFDLAQYIFDESHMLNYDLVGDAEEFDYLAYALWDRTAMYYALQVAMESETTYELDDRFTNGEYFESTWSGIVKEAGLNAEIFLEKTYCYENENGTRCGVVAFKSADSLVQCKYIAIVASENGEARYFTAENDIMDTENWYFCEVTQEGRGTLGRFAKENPEADLEAFVDIAFDIYEDNAE